MSRSVLMNPTFLPPTHGVLKSLLEKPTGLPLRHEGFGKEEKAKSLDDEVSAAPQSAFLGPTLWDKTLAYDGDSFQLEYMDLEEFLSENGIPSSEQSHQQPLPPVLPSQTPSSVITSTAMPPHRCVLNTVQPVLPPQRDTPSPIDPESIQVAVSYEPDPADLAMSSVPGQEMFDPRKRRFTEEELKPQPMIKKARKVFTPDEMKDEKYWVRRRKNNMAAKRSRDARRLKENQIAVRASFLEKENSALRQEVAQLRKEVGRCRNIMAKYESL
ncbi:HLF transcription factor, PAR bZIP family member b isoform X2 [Clupea harengus]|uniref:HLF transcription factor, PAR bZIP family member b isoform X2 n=1 Tax=Clupea harengus TaxID=7950 RepID=A0A6P3W700_CLUHA|nr:HLF transcription factor, PAR bZIP family member b isoform X2 [Clupea harengus]